jgi:mannan endo-1,4-beta-mannosidase
MSARRGLLNLTVATITTLSTLAVGIGAAQGAARHTAAAPQSMRLARVMNPTNKYYGVYVSQAPASLAPIDKVTQETGKQPNLSLYYQDWGPGAAAGTSNIQITSAENACNNGMLPMMTWESWDTSVRSSDGAVAVTQPAFAPAKIAAGDYDAYIRASADLIKTLNCPIAIRLDQEVNGDWYPWAINTPGMNNSAADYVAMWRHVWQIFASEGVTNVLWVWSPNVQSLSHPNLPDLSASYPGDSYVDWVGVDGYIYNNPNETFYQLFQPTVDQLKTFVDDKPWIVAECGVGSGSSKPAQITNMIDAVAHRHRFIGMNYFDTNKPFNASNWTLDETSSSLAAFSAAISSPVFATGQPGLAPGDLAPQNH